MKALFVRIDRSPLLSQLIPLSLTLVVFIIFVALLHAVLLLFNRIPQAEYVRLTPRWYDIAVGATIYLKTSIDFAIFMGRLMASNPGWRNRIAIEIGTAAGNTIGTIAIIGLWVVFKNVELLLAGMVFIASLVLFELANGSLEHIKNRKLRKPLHWFLRVVTRFTPKIGIDLSSRKNLPWWGLLGFSMSVPFILGLDDFAGYVPLFTVVNVYGFAIGVIGAHTLLNIALFLSPRRTIEAVRNEIVSFLGALAFIGLGIYGLVETVRILFEVFT
ncbi:MAG: hypothetical protein ACD_36C00100G0001 [uncultured bacterium]|uniref:Uncharacterized protein n=1 Tax=Candidatus Gottesmanbacteria bacterium RIFCSPLOWO2_01_FULL_43_11b TaxID=1798392 RepID=A0A1F6AGS3_9BACT|nr:MAG: hypothetical protein ACD_36C00100G0001 [uncultured bacterium]OGG23885.1 MAG: hypothetical protein A3A79_01650 [Candidatus Gottesmanbacteria bacterium RIFCSPLOWO2_01_FULL_43_11b]